MRFAFFGFPIVRADASARLTTESPTARIAPDRRNGPCICQYSAPTRRGLTSPYDGRIFPSRMTRKAVPESPKSLATYLASGVETQEALAMRAGVSQAHISRIAAGGSCSLQLAKTLAALTGIPIESIGSEEVA